MWNLIVRSILFWMVIVCSALTLNGQCLSDAEVIAKVAEIHSNTAERNVKKIEELKALQNRFFKCSMFKNSAYAQIVHRLGDVYGKEGDTEKAIIYTREAVAVNEAKSASDKAFLANSYFNLGIFYKRLHLLKESHHYFDKCINIASIYPDRYFIAFMAFEQKAYYFYQTGDYQKSIEVADEGLLFALEVKNPLARAALLAQRAQSAAELNYFELAELNIKEAISLLEYDGADVQHLATAYSVYAGVLNKKGRISACISYYKKAFFLNKQNDNLEQCSRDLMDLGRVYMDNLNQGPIALFYYNEGIKMGIRTGDSYQLAALYSNVGVVHCKAKNYRKALRYYQKSLNMLPLNFTDTAIHANLNAEMLKLVSNDYFVSTIIANKGAALLGLYQQTKDLSVLKLALKTLEIADQAVDVMRWKQYGEQSKLIWRQKTRRMYENAIEVCYYLKNLEKAYYFFEKSRAVLLNDQLSELIAENYISKKEQLTEKQLRTKAYVLSQKLLATNKNATQYSAIRTQWYNAQEIWEQYINGIEKKYPAYYQYKYDNSVTSYHKVKAKLSKQRQTLVEYFTGDSAIYALLLAPAVQKLLKIPYPEYDKHTKAFLSLCADRSALNINYDKYCKLANQLYKRLFKPLSVPEGRVIVSPDDHFIPFEALLSDAKVKDSFLAKKYTFSYVHSMRVLMKKNNKTLSEPNFLGIAPLNYKSGTGLLPLPGSDLALQKIAANFKTSRLLIGSHASRSEFLRNLTKYRLVQVYAHADANSSRKEPILYLADSAVYLSEIQKLNFPNTDLVVLSACNTGAGRNARGEGVFSLARAFMIAGVPATVTNLWQIDDKITYQLTELFYKYLQQGLNKDEALTRAKLDFLAHHDQLQCIPYFWASTIIIGNTDVAARQSNLREGLPVFIISVFILLISLFLIFKRKK